MRNTRAHRLDTEARLVSNTRQRHVELELRISAQINVLHTRRVRLQRRMIAHPRNGFL